MENVASSTSATSAAQSAPQMPASQSSKPNKRCQKCQRKVPRPLKDRTTVEYQQTWHQYERSRGRSITLPRSPRSPEGNGCMPRHTLPRPTYLEQAHAGVQPTIRLQVRAPSTPAATRLSSAEMVAKLHEAIARHQESLRRVVQMQPPLVPQPGVLPVAVPQGSSI